MIIYIHGFASSGLGGKAKLFKEEFKDEIILPSLSYVPSLAINTLEQLIESFLNLDEKVSLIGSSLGGFYCLYLASKYNLKAVLINPAIKPYKTLDKIGLQTNYFDFSSFEVKEEHMIFLKTIKVNIKNSIKEENFLLLVQKADEVLDYKEALDFLPKATLFLEDGGNHSFKNIKSHFLNIKNFLQ